MVVDEPERNEAVTSAELATRDYAGCQPYPALMHSCQLYLIHESGVGDLEWNEERRGEGRG